MSRTIEEQLSELLDDELPPMEEQLLLRRLAQGGEHRATMSRYALIGEILRGNAMDGAGRDFADRVREAVDAESVHDGATARSGGGWRYAGFGVAAGIVAAVALLLVSGRPPGVPGAPAQPVASPVAQPLRFDDFDAERVPRSRLAPARLTAYLVSHGDYSRGLSRQIMNSHVVNQRAELLQAGYVQDGRGD